MLLEALSEDGRFGPTVLKDLKPCFVPDIFGFDDLRVLFIVESPHTEEVRYGAPLSGRSGADMTRVLLDRVFNRKDIREPLPFGRCLLFQNAFFKHFGAMNVCNLPLQRAAFKKIAPGAQQKYGELFDAFKTIRSNPKAANRQSKTAARIDRMIVADFTGRLRSRKQTDPLVIPCGNAARAFVEKSGVNLNPASCLNGIPHPSYGQWRQSGNRDVIEEMCRRIRERISNKPEPAA